MPRRFARPHRRGMFSGAAGSGGGFSPRQLGGLVLWLRSDLGITLNGSTVSAWADQSGQGNSVTQGTASAQPTYAAADSSFGGHPSLAFVSANSQTLRNASWSQAQPITIYHVGQLTSFAGSVSRAAVDSVTTEATGVFGTSAAGAAGVWSVFAGSTLAGGTDDLSPHVFGAVVNGASGVLAVDSSAGTSGAVGASASTLLAIGGQTGTFLDGKIVEIAVYSSAHTAAQRQRVFQYLGARYGISVS